MRDAVRGRAPAVEPARELQANSTILLVLLESNVTSIEPESVTLSVGAEAAPLQLPNDDVFLMLGGTPPFELLRSSGVSFDPELRPSEADTRAPRSLLWSVGAALALTLGAALWVGVHRAYYGRSWAERAVLGEHPELWPSRGVGLGLGVLATLLLASNLAYLLRRARWFPSEGTHEAIAGRRFPAAARARSPCLAGPPGPCSDSAEPATRDAT